MKSQDINVYREIQRNAEMAMKAIDTISDKVYDAQLNLQILKQANKYAEIKNRACDRLLQENVEPYRANYLSNLMLTGAIHYNTLLNNSTGRIAELMIKGSNMGILEMNKILNHNDEAAEKAVVLAKELIAIENKNIDALTKYL